jgi:uncharacterized protein YecT (DUF1311 family)
MLKYLLIAMLLPVCALAEANLAAVDTLERCVLGERQESDAAVCIGKMSRPCMEEPGGYSTAGMATCTFDEADAWDVLLNRYYGHARVLARDLDAGDQENFPEYSVRAETLLAAQRAWITFRDANCAAEYAQGGSGTIRQLFGASCHLHMTAKRAIWLFNYSESVL